MNDFVGMTPPNSGSPTPEDKSAPTAPGVSNAPKSPPIGPGYSHTAIELLDAGFGAFMVPVKPRDKVPARLEADGCWHNVSSVTAFCASRDEAREWDEAGASVGLRGGGGLVWIDNDFGETLTQLVQKHLGGVRRFVDSPTHHRDAFLFRVSGEIKTFGLKFRDPNSGAEGDFGLRGSGQQAVVTGIHKDTGRRYLTNIKLTRIEDVPEIPTCDFSDAFLAIVNGAKALGLEIVKGSPGSDALELAVQRVLGLGLTAQTPPQTQTQTSPQNSLSNGLLDPEELRWLLMLIPNDLTSANHELVDFLSVYDNWRDVCYAMIGATGGSSEGRDDWIEWSDQEVQPKVSSSYLWDHCIHSAQTGGGVRLGGRFLLRLAQRFNPDGYLKPFLDIFEKNPVAIDDEPDEIDEVLIAQKMPDIDPKAFYGPLASIVEAATKNSEATKIGVGLQTIAQASMCLRPFYAPLGDQRLPLNLFALQVGQSSRGRKGTSAAFADNFLAPTIRTVASETQWSRQLAAADAQKLADARAAVTEAACLFEWTLFVTPDDAKRAADKITALQSEKADLERHVAAWKTKLTAKVYSPVTTRKHERSIAEGEAKIESLKDEIATIEVEKARVEAVLMDPAGKRAEARQAVADAKAAVAALPAVASVEPWQDLFGVLARPPETLTGVGSGEGLISSIRDPRAGRGEDDQRNDLGSVEKRLFVNMSEFGSVLALVRRLGSTLSAVLRNLYDCVPVETATKVSPVSCAEPFTTLSASITPQELKGLLFDERDIAATADNGLGNRFLYLFVARDKLVANPLPTEDCDALTRKVAENIRDVYAELKPVGAFLSTPIEFTPEAMILYKHEIYARIDGLSGASQNAARLSGRMTTNLRKLAAILAVIAGESRISVDALKAAVAWIEYAAATVNVVASTVMDRRQMLRLHEDAEAVLEALKGLGADRASVSHRDARRRADLDAARFKGAVGWLLNKAPAPLAVDIEDFVSGNGVKRKKTLLRLV